jgi:hypothetical protein
MQGGNSFIQLVAYRLWIPYAARRCHQSLLQIREYNRPRLKPGRYCLLDIQGVILKAKIGPEVSDRAGEYDHLPLQPID